MGIEQENVNLKIEIASLKAANTQQKRKISALEGHLCKTETQIDNLLCKLNSANETVRSLQQEVSLILICTHILCVHICICLYVNLNNV